MAFEELKNEVLSGIREVDATIDAHGIEEVAATLSRTSPLVVFFVQIDQLPPQGLVPTCV